MRNLRVLLVAVPIVTGGLLLSPGVVVAAGGGGAGVAGGGGFGGGGFHGGSIGNPGPVTGGYGYWGIPYSFGPVIDPTPAPQTSNPLGSGGDQPYEVYGPRDPGAATDPPLKLEPRGTVAPDDVLDQGGPGDPLTGHLNDDWWEVGASAQGAAAAGPAVGTAVPKLPIGYKSGTVGTQEFFYREGVFYAAADSGYEVIAPPLGATVATIPGSAELVTVDKQQYFDLDGVYYQAFYSGNGLVYKVVEDPTS